MEQKITPEQKDEIFEAYIRIKKPSDRWSFQAKMAEKYGVHRSTINRIIRDEKRIAKYERALAINHRLSMLQVGELAFDALSVQAELIHDDTLPANMQYLRQNAAVDVMNRAGLKRKEEATEQHMVISFGGMPEGLTLGAPEPSEHEECDG